METGEWNLNLIRNLIRKHFLEPDVEEILKLKILTAREEDVLAWALMTHKYRGSQQSSREVLPKFIDST
jgi:hypothetical protein